MIDWLRNHCGVRLYKILKIGKYSLKLWARIKCPLLTHGVVGLLRLYNILNIELFNSAVHEAVFDTMNRKQETQLSFLSLTNRATHLFNAVAWLSKISPPIIYRAEFGRSQFCIKRCR